VHTLEAPLAAAMEKARAFVMAGRGAYLPSSLEEAVKTTSAEGVTC
jgi:hypothetical protein